MKAKIVKLHKGEVASSIERTFLDEPSLYEFLREHGVNISFREASANFQLAHVTYSLPLLNVEASSDYQ